MLVRPIVKLSMLTLTGFIVVVAAGGLGAGAKTGETVSPGLSQEFGFSLSQLPENPTRYSLVISDADERTISGVFTIDQLQILRAIMTEAEKFALAGEASGVRDPITTRFADKQEVAFIVDVEKLGDQSRLFLTLKSEIGRMTVEAGRISRSNRREDGFFFDLLSRLESVLPKKPAQPPK